LALRGDELTSDNDSKNFKHPMLSSDEIKRIAMTASCADSSEIPKVWNAGEFGLDEHGPFQVMHNGIKITKDCYQGPWMSKVIELLRGHHEPQEELAFHEVLKTLKSHPSNFQDQNILELGSFWGYYSLWFAKEFPESKVVCLEPDIHHMEVGEKNFLRNDVSGRFINAKIARESKLRSRFVCPSDGIERVVEALSFSGVLEKANLTEVDIVHVDVQGAEIDLLLDLSKVLLKTKIRFIFVSTHDLVISGSPTTHQDSLRLLESNGAHIICEHSVPESFSGDGFILASFFEEDKNLEVDISYNRSKNSLFGEWEPRMADLVNLHSRSRRLTSPFRKILRRLQRTLI
jgi:FkbM family methyltransferase